MINLKGPLKYKLYFHQMQYEFYFKKESHLTYIFMINLLEIFNVHYFIVSHLLIYISLVLR